MRRQRLEIDDLGTVLAERAEQPALAGPRQAAYDAPLQRAGEALEICDHLAAVRAISAVKAPDVPADLRKDVRKCGAALASAPAIDERTPVPRTVEEARVQVARNVAAYDCRADLPRVERRKLFVDRADAGALFVIEHRTVRGAANVVRSELAFRAHIDDLVKLV